MATLVPTPQELIEEMTHKKDEDFNDGRHDRHEQLIKEPLWWGILPGIHELAVCFSEGTQKRTAG